MCVKRKWVRIYIHIEGAREYLYTQCERGVIKLLAVALVSGSLLDNQRQFL